MSIAIKHDTRKRTQVGIGGLERQQSDNKCRE